MKSSTKDASLFATAPATAASANDLSFSPRIATPGMLCKKKKKERKKRVHEKVDYIIGKIDRVIIYKSNTKQTQTQNKDFFL